MNSPEDFIRDFIKQSPFHNENEFKQYVLRFSSVREVLDAISVNDNTFMAMPAEISIPKIFPLLLMKQNFIMSRTHKTVMSILAILDRKGEKASLLSVAASIPYTMLRFEDGIKSPSIKKTVERHGKQNGDSWYIHLQPYHSYEETIDILEELVKSL